MAFGVSDYDQVSSKFLAHDRPILASAGHQGERWCYVDAPGGAVFELREE